MADISKKTIGAIKAIIAKSGVQDADALVIGFTDGRTSHVSKMTQDEGNALMRHLNKESGVRGAESGASQSGERGAESGETGSGVRRAESGASQSGERGAECGEAGSGVRRAESGAQGDKAEKMRRKLIAMAYERSGINNVSTDAERKDVVKRLDAWCVKYGYGKKKLNKYTYNELPKLLSQYEKALEDTIEHFS